MGRENLKPWLVFMQFHAGQHCVQLKYGVWSVTIKKETKR